MKTLLILWLSIPNGVATDSVKTIDFESMAACESYTAVAMLAELALSYQCLEGYSVGRRGAL